jgi:hypothetical protein
LTALTDGSERARLMSKVRTFEFAFAPSYRVPAATFGITQRTARVDVGDGTFTARFGPWRVTTPLANVKAVDVTGPYRFIKTAGPARLAITDLGLTFATNDERGVLVRFRTYVRGLDPLGLIRHPELTVTVADVEGLAAALKEQAGLS